MVISLINFALAKLLKDIIKLQLMPYKRTFRKRRPYRARRFKRKYNLNKRVNYISKYIRKMQELKNHDVSISLSPDTSETFTNLSLIPQGDTSLTRDGNKILAKSLSYHLKLTAADSTNIVRVVFLIDKASLALTPTNYLETVSDPISFRSADSNVGRYKVLSDKMYVLGTDAGQVEQKYISGHFRLNKPIDYASSSTATAIKNNIWMMTISDSGVASHPSVDGHVRVRFVA